MKSEYIRLPVYEICSAPQAPRTILVDPALLNSVMDQLRRTAGPKERGGAFGFSRKEDSCILETFLPDDKAEATSDSFKPSADLLKAVQSSGQEGIGFIHTHRQEKSLSREDFAYIKAFFEANPPLKQLFSGVFAEETERLYLYFFERTAFMNWYRSERFAYLHRISDALCPPVPGIQEADGRYAYGETDCT